MQNLHQIREISTLSFNERVLQEAEDPRNPLMERLRFLGIFSSNMDELFKVRVASINRRLELGKKSMQLVLEVIGEKARNLDDRFQAAYANITQALAKEGIRLVTEQDIAGYPRDLLDWLRHYFQTTVLPSLVPIILQKTLPFPQLTDGALYFGIRMEGEKTRYAVLEIPSALPRFVELPNGNIMYLDDVIRHSLNDVFYIFDYSEIEAFEFKISRDAELDIDNDFSEGYIRKMERVLQQRKGGRPTRLVYDESMPAGLLKILVKELKINEKDLLIGGGRYHNMRDLMQFPDHRPEHMFDKIAVAPHPVLDRERVPMLDLIRRQDLLVTYPYQSFDHLIRLLREAAIDPKVDAISMSLYRVAYNSQVINALLNAARNGKRIVANIELLARFDEKNNIDISERLREVGASVTYGVPPMKVHGKILLIERKGQYFGALSTGNFNETTGRLYVDSLLLTADKRLTAEIAAIFRYLEHAARMHALSTPRFKHLIVSPFNARNAFQKLIAREKAKGKDGYMLIKVNHLTDEKIIAKIQEAADAGVKMDHIVRTTYSMSPHDNVRAISIVDRFLEHQRVYIFGMGKDRRVFLSSADLMERNLDWRVEVAFPVYDEALQQQVIDMMAMQVSDTYKARVLDETQSNQYIIGGSQGKRAQYEAQRYFHQLYLRAERQPSESETVAP
ncbi:MAG: polyphosphate kinase 1 [Candidatus Hydrogenedentes bacterium]|nr:polyphosphate kinase 1 [Candidatus Hydrogenedentota bacterium]